MRRKQWKKGYTIPTALLLLLLLFAFAVGLLMFASYNYNNAYKRHEKMQTYLYAKNILDECEYAIMDGRLNPFLIRLIDEVNQNLSVAGASGEDTYGKEYQTKLALSDTELLVNEFNQDKIGVEMFITYKPNAAGNRLPAENGRYLSVGDRMEIEFRIGKAETAGEEYMEYRITSEYYCSYDDSKNTDGTLVPDYGKWPSSDPLTPDVDKTVEEKSWNMKWQPFQYTGNIYTN